MNEQTEKNITAIKACAKRKGVKLIDIANALGVSQSGFAQYLRGDMSLTRAQSIAQILGVTLDEMLGKTPEPQTECDTVTIQGKKYKVAFTPIDE